MTGPPAGVGEAGPQQSLSWYDRIARLYDIATLGDRFYADMRRQAVASLDLAPGDAVVDLFCGTGVDLPLLGAALKGQGRIVAVDGSAAMLKRAELRAPRLPDGVEVAPVRLDLATPAGRRALSARIETAHPSGILFPLGLSVIESWRALFVAAFEAAPPGCRFAILDDHALRDTLGKRLVDWIGAADISRPVWQELEARAEGFARRSQRLLPCSSVEVFVATGTKPRA